MMQKMSIKNCLVNLSAIVAGALLLVHATISVAQTALEDIEQAISRETKIVQVSTEYVLARDKDADNNTPSILLFDVREPDEFAVSHLPGAIRLAPDTTAEAFLRDYGGRLDGITPVFYCSVGRRSNALAETVAAYSKTHALSVVPVNLRGGIFRWHNEAKPLVNEWGTTDQVHPYNWYWRRLLEHRQKSAYQPAEPASADEPAPR
jgi:rhodanese-related sulfurtransferase